MPSVPAARVFGRFRPRFSTVQWHQAAPSLAPWKTRYSWLRWYNWRLQFQNDRSMRRWAADQIRLFKPDLCYVFTQVGLETLQWAQDAGAPTVHWAVTSRTDYENLIVANGD